ncbi:MAG: PIN domain-containing protein [Betaproteobacteria bacterium]|nr:PIN domain-containing protein [Betaproteobacteria bacterium]
MFFDSNILLYGVDDKEPGKQSQAQPLLVKHYAAEQAVISTQVLQEFYNIATGKLRIHPERAARLAREYASAQVVQVTPSLIFDAMERHQNGGFSFWDALIVEAALLGGCAVLYSEDMQDGQTINGLTIRNPFVGAPHA